MSILEDTRIDPAASDSDSSCKSEPDLQRIGQYRLLRRLGEGGMGVVYLAYHPKMKKQVAVKVLAEQYNDNQNFIDRFYREAKSGALLNHPHIVRSYGVGQDKKTNRHYLVLEYIDGPSAMCLLQHKGRVSVSDTVRITYDIACALEHAHSRNVVHRDIKPDNILITKSGMAKLADLGLAKRTDEVSHLTAARQAFGTPHYMPYEQALNARRADYRSDIYALGATAYHLVTGELPFPGDNPVEVVEKKDIGEVVPPSEICNMIPTELDDILLQMMARHPRDRYQTASELIIDLERSGLVKPLLSFADPNLAWQDPTVRARAHFNQSQPTQPDMGSVISRSSAEVEEKEATDERIWHVRYRVEGKWRKLQLTQPQLEQRLLKRRIPITAEASRAPGQEFTPLEDYEELRELVRQIEQTLAKKRATKSSTEEEVTLVEMEPASRRRLLPSPLVLLSAAVSVAVLSVLFWQLS